MMLIFPLFVVYAIEMGSSYNYRYNYKLILDKTTVSEAIAQYGKPMERYTIKTEHANYVFLRYYSTDAGLFSGSGRMVFLQFRDNLLYSYITGSNFEYDSTKFNYTKAKEIKVGDAIDEVIYSIGEPAGKAKCPINSGAYSGFCKKGEYTWMWLYAKQAGIMNYKSIRAKAVLVGVDKDGNVIEVERERIAVIKN